MYLSFAEKTALIFSRNEVHFPSQGGTCIGKRDALVR